MNVTAARAIADEEVASRSQRSTRKILKSYRLAADPDGVQPVYVPTAGRPDWHRFYYRLEDCERYLLVVVSTAGDRPNVEFCRLHGNARITLAIWSRKLTLEEITDRIGLSPGSRVDEPDIHMWMMDSETLGPAVPDELVNGVLDMVAASQTAFRTLLSSADVRGDLNISVPRLDGHAGSCLIDRETLERVAAFGLSLTFTVQAPT